jgi:nuclear pore complex protein Nup62
MTRMLAFQTAEGLQTKRGGALMWPFLSWLQMLETHQKGIHDALVGMEGEAERLYREERPLMDDETRCASLAGGSSGSAAEADVVGLCNCRPAAGGHAPRLAERFGPAVCRERDRLYERAEKVAALLSHLGEQLKEAIADVNDSTAASLGDSATPLGKAVRVLNNQLQALAQVDARIDEVSQHVADLQAN